jgi:CRISPR-associated endonuclease/helicase Cas3
MGRPDRGAAVAAFRELTKRRPYEWQERLLCCWLLDGRLPEAVDIPTGLGKTAAIALWLSALAIGVGLPRRLIYVVDRRTVVDQATDEADALASALGEGQDDNPRINALRRGLGLRPGQRLPVSTLRGQHLDNRLWLENPAAPAIVVGTVDMIGSRLLFEGYGVSPRMRPVQAGLVGADALIMLDEAHLVPPFESLLRSVAAMPATAPVPRFHLMTLSATGRKRESDTFGLLPEDWEDAPVRARLDAPKRLRLSDVAAGANLAETLAKRAFEMGEGGKRVLVFCNSRGVAQSVCDWLAKKIAKSGLSPELLVGARRVHERERLKDSPVFRRFDPKAQSREGEAIQPVYLVATSAGEVGVDLDADHMVCDLVPWERLVQRLGRVNRRAVPGESLIDVFCRIPADDAEDTADAVRLARWRAPFDSEAWPTGTGGRRDASPGMLHQLKDDPNIQPVLKAATSEEPLRPDLTPALVEAWSMTSLPVHPGRPDVEPWLRGWVDSQPRTRVLWRRLLPARPHDDPSTREKTLGQFFQYAPPHITEILETLTSEVVDTLQKRAKTLLSAQDEGRFDGEIPSIGAVALSRRGEVDEVMPLKRLAELPAGQLRARLAGQTVALDARLGGLGEAGLLDAKIDTAPATLDGEESPAWGTDFLQTAGFRVRRVPADREPEHDWPIEWRWRTDPDDDSDDGGEIRVEIWRRAGATSGDSAIARIPQRLGQHHDWTASEADVIARRLMLPEEYRKMLVAAAAVHDAGKARELWQRAMRAPRDGRPYAKTVGGGIPSVLQVNGQTYRHEFGSLRDTENDPMIQALPEELRDLALHLITAHHGFARPVIAAVDPENTPSASAELARAAGLRFARLQARWGPWGLAWWEALLRAADWAASRELNERAEGG